MKSKYGLSGFRFLVYTSSYVRIFTVHNWIWCSSNEIVPCWSKKLCVKTTIMIGRILEELPIIMTLEKWHKSLFTCDMLLILVILITYHFFRCDLYNHVRCKLGIFYFVNRNNDVLLSYCERVLGRPRWRRSNSVGFKILTRDNRDARSSLFLEISGFTVR